MHPSRRGPDSARRQGRHKMSDTDSDEDADIIKATSDVEGTSDAEQASLSNR